MHNEKFVKDFQVHGIDCIFAAPSMKQLCMKTRTFVFFYTCLFCLITSPLLLAQRTATDANTPLHLVKPEYPVPYGIPQIQEVKFLADRILNYLELATPCRLENGKSHLPVNDTRLIDENTRISNGTFRLFSYEWGVTYSAMLRMGYVTRDERYLNYTLKRMRFMSDLSAGYRSDMNRGRAIEPQMRQVLNPGALDDAGSMCAALIKATAVNGDNRFSDVLIRNYANYILNKENRLPDGTFSRNRPFVNTVWLDDMYMSIPAIAQYGVYTGQHEYIRQAAQLVLRFADKMFVSDKNLFRHGWVESMSPHPSFFWGRANGWAFLTLCEVLDVLPENDPQRPMVLSLFQRHAYGLMCLQSPKGFWHQLLDKEDTYEETSATAIFTYGLAHGINKGWIKAGVFGPAALLGWNAVSTKINREGKVTGTCVGTGMGFDPAFYAYRPVSDAAAHGYGPVLYAAAEIIELLKLEHPVLNDNAVQFYENLQSAGKAIFNEERSTGKREIRDHSEKDRNSTRGLSDQKESGDRIIHSTDQQRR